jgi:hypothetical protein
MSETPIFYEVFPLSLKRQGEEVCGDQVKVFRTPEKTIMVLSDGLGNGIKAAILARLTTEIIVTMLRAGAPLEEVIETVIGTLPTCKERGLAYATFAILQIQHANGHFNLVNFDSPPAILLKHRQPFHLETRNETICGKSLSLSDGVLENDDFLGLMSDGVLYADMGVTMNPSWGWAEIAACLAKTAQTSISSAERLVQTVMNETRKRYGEAMGDDATFVGVLARNPRRLVIFTGPPADKNRDTACVERLLKFEGRRVICGGTTGNIVADYLGETIHTDEGTAREGIPPVGDLPEVDLITEGILTMARTLELLKESGGNTSQLPVDRNGAVLLARKLLQADSILFLAGESVNPYYQNPQLPRSISIRRSLVTQIAETLQHFQKEVAIEWL